jgi:hypothetical protein
MLQCIEIFLLVFDALVEFRKALNIQRPSSSSSPIGNSTNLPGQYLAWIRPNGFTIGLKVS